MTPKHGGLSERISPQPQAPHASGVPDIGPNTALFHWDVAADAVYCSDEVFALYGISSTPSPITSRQVLAVVHPDDRPWLRTAVRKALASGGIFSHCYRIIRPDGSIRWLRASSTVVTCTARRPSQVFGTLRDITDGKEGCEANVTGRFSRREGQVLMMLADGLDPVRIASSLGIKPHTVRDHLQNMRRKLGVHSQVQLLAVASRLGYLA